MWDNVVETGNVIQGHLTPEVRVALLREHPSIDASELVRIGRLKQFHEKMPAYIDLQQFYWRGGPFLFCKAMFGEDMTVAEQRAIISTFKFSMSPSEHFWIEAAQECADARELSDKSAYLVGNESQKSEMQAVYSVSYFWSFFLAFGLALKLTKTTSDLVALRKRKAAASTVSASPS
ncbi:MULTISPECIES: hypothetical protein [unclassified Bradyrhizobium]|uniref:hypothetical protein n=1 Tax=unclassified Bradyrhizobium TaxID=2631580 RepID=UPI0029161B40|nr:MULTISPECIES: hypothetical protein [unclassified Bradyrhizobium]